MRVTHRPVTKGPEGMALILALLIMSSMFLLVAYLTRATLTQIKTGSAAAWRTQSVRNAESALLKAFLALRDGQAKPGANLTIDGHSIACGAHPDGVELAVVVFPGGFADENKPLSRPTRRVANLDGGRGPDRGIRLVWRMKRVADRWRRVDWRCENISRAPTD